jgi:hypothetical protein
MKVISESFGKAILESVSGKKLIKEAFEFQTIPSDFNLSYIYDGIRIAVNGITFADSKPTSNGMKFAGTIRIPDNLKLWFSTFLDFECEASYIAEKDSVLIYAFRIDYNHPGGGSNGIVNRQMHVAVDRSGKVKALSDYQAVNSWLKS